MPPMPIYDLSSSEDIQSSIRGARHLAGTMQ
jgi:hypothetical protein